MSKTNPLIEKLDNALLVLRDNIYGLTFGEVFRKLYENGTETQNAELIALLEKLKRDRYIIYEQVIVLSSKEVYKITYDGLIFAHAGGYASIEWKKNRDWEMARRLEKSQSKMQEHQTQMLVAQADTMKE